MKTCTDCFNTWEGDLLICVECGSITVQDDFEDDELEKQRVINHYWKNKGI